MRVRHRILIAYLGLLVLSWIVEAVGNDSRSERRETRARQGLKTLALPAVGEASATSVDLAYRDLGPDTETTSVVLLLHGSPGGIADFGSVTQSLDTGPGGLRVLIPDLPGFGASTRAVPDYSIRAHAQYALGLLDALGIDSAHWVGFSMGGGVALSASQLSPQHLRSLTLLSAIGVQEHELLGDYTLNHLVHGLQLFSLRALDWGLPHFGALDAFPLNPFYARNFFDSDQRPLREALTRLDAPTLILHGEQDPLVPVEAAREHERLVPQSELVVYPEGHFVLWQRSEEIADTLERFWARVESGEAASRSDASAERQRAAALPASQSPAARGPVAWLAFALLVLAATLVSEDLTCIGVGFLVARGQIDFGAGVAACAFGLWAGDLMLYAAGRFGARWVPRRGRTRLEAARKRFQRSGAALILASRFLPGARLPIYLGAGAARYPVLRFSLLLLVGAAVWTPLLVGASARFGDLVLGSLERFRHGSALALATTMVVLLFVTRVALPLLSHRGRRFWRGRVERWRRWEFWPMWLFYPPIAAYIGWLGLRHGGLRTATAANPAIPAGGLIGESKWEILRGLADAGDAIADTVFLRRGDSAAARHRAVATTLGVASPAHPIVIKPDIGERGKGVAIVRDEETLRRELANRDEDTLAQQYIPGVEYGVFYVRRPGQARGEIISITDKQMVSVVGDGKRSLRRLILDDARAVCMAQLHLDRHEAELDRILALDELFTLTELGTHCRGALFLDGGHLATDALADRVDAISKTYRGFFFGRYDLRCDSAEALGSGAFRVVELNGLSSESTHIYDPRHTLGNAYRTLFAQWRIAFEIGASNRRDDAPVASWGELWRLLRSARA